MGTDPFLVGRYIYWQGTISHITAISDTGKVLLEHFHTRSSCKVDLTTLQEALSTASLLIGCAIEQEQPEADTGDHSCKEQRCPSRDRVITYLPIFNVESFFTDTQTLVEQKQPSADSRQGHPSRKTKQWGKEKGDAPTLHYESNERLPQEDISLPTGTPKEEAGMPEYMARRKSKGEEYSPEALKHALQGPGRITIRWLNCYETGLLHPSLLAPASQPNDLCTQASMNWEVDQQVCDIVTTGQWGFTAPIWTVLIERRSRLIIEGYLASHIWSKEPQEDSSCQSYL